MITVLALTAVFPSEAYSFSAAKARYSLYFNNINSDTVIKKGSKLKIKYHASKGKKIKVKFKSSNKKIATVSQKGVIRAKRNGKVKITIYDKKNKKIKKTVTIRVGQPVSSINITGIVHIQPGRSSDLDAVIEPLDATNQKLKWSSSNKKIATVNKRGKIRAIKEGEVKITATALDGSGVKASVTVVVRKFRRTDTKWVAHRGYHDEALENTAEAFILAGEAGFWGAECDVWETGHDTVERQSLPVGPELTQKDKAVIALEEAIQNLPEDEFEIIDSADTVNRVQDMYDALTEEQKCAADTELLDRLFDAEYIIDDYNSFDLVLSHDNSYRRLFGVDAKIGDLGPSSVINNTLLRQLCFVNEYLIICGRYDMVPVVELKDPDMSEAATKKLVDSIVKITGSLDHDKVHFSSFYADQLNQVREYCKNRYDCEPYTAYQIRETDVESKIETARDNKFTGISITRLAMDQDVMELCRNYGLLVDTWIYLDHLYDDERLYEHFISGNYQIESAITDSKLFE